MQKISHETIRDDRQTQLFFNNIHAHNELLYAHWHEHLEILYLTAGNMTACINEVSYELSSGDCLIVNPRDIHYTHTYDECCYYLLQIPPIHLERISAEWKRIHFTEYISHTPVPSPISQLFYHLAKLKEQEKSGYQLLFLSAIYDLLHLLYTEHSSLISIESRIRSDRDFERIEQSMEYVKEHFSEPITLTEVSRQLSISTEYFCRLFKKYTGQTFLAYINQVRLLAFYQDLINTHESVTFLLDKNGITNYKAFMRDFKKAYGTTPHRLRKLTKDTT